MEPALREGDLIRIGIDYYAFFPLQRNDIVIIDFNVDNSLRVKRLVGLPGDNVQITPAGDIAVNGVVALTHPVGQPFTSDSFPLFKYPSPATSRVVPLHKVFVISDNAEAGFDSLDYGFVDEGFVIGKVVGTNPPAVSN
ncbi:MAG: signal peptidase I [Candidatus Iainarchaeum archaeon]|uniref:Signal peptidase I n=1 Tax=Candidatus Iainarchaeum sp. TaxID=3101447 RepID=A0A7T9I1R5_9ARCH|nr:MAG: signal peptidase I [Candidatus Diapherotrites archaeon]